MSPALVYAMERFGLPAGPVCPMDTIFVNVSISVPVFVPSCRIGRSPRERLPSRTERVTASPHPSRDRSHPALGLWAAADGGQPCGLQPTPSKPFALRRVAQAEVGRETVDAGGTWSGTE